MPIGRNLKSTPEPSFRSNKKGKKNYPKIVFLVVIIAVIAFGAYGAFNLFNLAPREEDKKEIILETGDRPLPEEVKIRVVASGGLNMRSEPNTKSSILTIIPNNTELIAIEIDGEWYRVSFNNQTGWVHNDFVKNLNEDSPIEEETLNWKRYSDSKFGYSILYPNDWVYRDFGSNQAANLLGYIGFGSQLPESIDPERIPPIVIKITNQPLEEVLVLYQKRTDATKETRDILGSLATRYTFIATSGIQMNAYIIKVQGRTLILEESGGYLGELSKMASSLKF